MTAARQELAEATTIWGLLERRVEMTPDRRMAMDPDGRTFTFAQVYDWSERVAAGLMGAGVGSRRVVAWQLPTRIEATVLHLALARLGVLQVAIIHLYRHREVSFLLEETRANLFVVPSVWKGFDYRAMATDLSDRQAFPQEVFVIDDDGLPVGDPGGLPPPPSTSGDVRYIYSTSGTTANPKAVRHTDGSLIAASTPFADALGLRADDVNAVCFPVAHIGGPVHLVASLRLGYPCLYIESFSVPDSVSALQEHDVTITGGSNAHFLMLLEEQRKQPERRLLPRLRLLYGGGAAKPPEIYWRTKDELGVEIRYAFGMTEAPVITCCTADDTDEQRATTDGSPLPGAEVLIADAEGTALPSGVEGEILVRGPMVANGYTDADLTREAFTADGYLRTGDRGLVRDDGRLVITGRTKDIIIRKGENISAREIEDVLTAHPKVAAAAVIGLPDAARGERVCAVVECRVGVDPLTFEEMQSTCERAGLMRQKWPEQLEVVLALPRNATLKVAKHELRAMLS
jgi:cyclohexanecarboxylate-CoA ligase